MRNFFPLLIASLALGTVSTLAAQEAARPQAPKTKIEAFDAQQGTVVIRGFSKMGELKGVYGGVVSVESMEFTHAATGRKEFGIAIDVEETSGLERESRSFIDYDEIDPLVKGIDYISKIDASATRLANFQADYRTKGDLRVNFQFIKGHDVFD